MCLCEKPMDATRRNNNATSRYEDDVCSENIMSVLTADLDIEARMISKYHYLIV